MSTAAATMDRRDIEAIHPLTPMQASLLFAALRAGPGGADPGFLQVRCTLRGDLDERALHAAWDRLIERHAALRTSIHWRNVERPLQVVARRAQIPWTVEDLRHLPPAARERHIGDRLTRDRTDGIDLSRAPVLRLARYRLADTEWTLVLSCHHVLLDGWSGAILLDEMAAIHDALRRGVDPALEPASPFGEYVRWLVRQDQTAAERHWRGVLAGAAGCATLPVPIAAHPAAGEGAAPLYATFGEERTAALQRFARSERLTAGSIVAAAWAALLAARAGNPDVCIGVTVSGRASPVPGITAMVGTLVNALPVRAAAEPNATVRAFLHHVQDRLVEVRQFEHAPADRVQEWSGLPGRVFDSLVVFENFPARRPVGADRLHVEDLRGGVTTTAALTLVAAPGPSLGLHLLHDARIEAAAARSLLDELIAILEAYVRAPDATVGAVGAAAAERGGRTAVQAGAGVAGRDRGSRRDTPANGAGAASDTVDPLELQLIQIFESVLRVHPVGVRDDFFALGGHSLLAARLFDRLERAFGRRLPLATLFEASTVDALAARLRSDGWRAPWSSLVAMQPDGQQAPLFCVHSYEGHILHYRDLARRLAPDVPVYGLQSLGLDGARPPLRTVEEMARHYLEEMRRVQPEGPYRIAGMCFGIAVAYEMAQQVVASGQAVDRLFILDSGFLHFLRPRPRPDRAFVRSMLQRAGAYGRALRARAGRTLRRLRETGHATNLRVVRENNERAWWSYEPKPYPGPITLLHSEGYGSRQDWHIETWSRLVGDIETYIVPGDHVTLVREPHVEQLAGRIRDCLGASAPDGGTARPV